MRTATDRHNVARFQSAGLIALAVLASAALMVGGAIEPSHGSGSGREALEAGEVALLPSDDSFVRVTNPSVNYDEDPLALSTTATGFPAGVPEDISYLRFDLTGITGTLTAARLRVYNRASPGGSVRVGAFDTADDDWNGSAAGLGDETAITHDVAPAAGSQLDEQVGSPAPAWMVFESDDLADYVADQIGGDGLVTLRLEVLSSGFADINLFEDREDTGGTGNAPELVLDGVVMATATASPTATDGPSATSTTTASATTSPAATAEASHTATASATHVSSVTASASPTATHTVPPSPHASASPSSTAGATSTVTASPTPSQAPSATPTSTPTPTRTPSATDLPTSMPTSSPTSSLEPTSSPTMTAAATSTATATSTAAATSTFTATPTSTSSATPLSPTPTSAPSVSATSSPRPSTARIFLPALHQWRSQDS